MINNSFWDTDFSTAKIKKLNFQTFEMILSESKLEMYIKSPYYQVKIKKSNRNVKAFKNILMFYLGFRDLKIQKTLSLTNSH